MGSAGSLQFENRKVHRCLPTEGKHPDAKHCERCRGTALWETAECLAPETDPSNRPQCGPFADRADVASPKLPGQPQSICCCVAGLDGFDLRL
jgi:hypothetical protein